ncbi:MAG: acyl--CoA ligase [Muribaculaceae bacterium]|nr:acyl--CoA ligase [Muribaculaceae bacterium]
MQSVEQDIWRNASVNPEKVAVKSGKEIVTYAELTARIVVAMEKLQQLPDYAPGKCIIVGASKQIEFVYIYFGAHLAGLTVAPIDTETNPDRFAYISNTLHPICVIGLDRITTETPILSLKEFKSLNNISGNTVSDEIKFPPADSIADILFTTGTTGTPKGVPLTYLNEAAAVRNINSFIRNSTDDVELLALPVSHSFGLGRLRCCLANGQTIILLGSFVNLKKFFRTIEEENVTGLTMVPASWKFIEKMSGEKLAEYSPQLRYIEMGSAFFSAEDKRRLAELFPVTRVTMHYGLTEASRSAFMEFHEDISHIDSVGKASPYTDIKIYSEQGRPLDTNEEGEICIKGEHVTKGYAYIDNDNTFYDSYFRTGDYGMIDVDGYIYLKSRIKELINVGGKKVSPSEVDEQILKIDGIEDCACVGIPDPEGIMGELVKAYIVKSAGSSLTIEEIRKALTGKLESYKLPVEYEWIEAIPKTQNGKIQRNLLK